MRRWALSTLIVGVIIASTSFLVWVIFNYGDLLFKSYHGLVR